MYGTGYEMYGKCKKPYFVELKIQKNFFILSYLLVDKKTVAYLLQEMFLPASS
jgi:hypothetical protein